MVGGPEEPGGSRRRGRWRTGEDSRRRILQAARHCFAEQGYDRATIRGIAARAHVDPAMLYYFFETKSQLFAAAMALPVDPASNLSSVLRAGVDDLGPRLVRHFLTTWDGQQRFEPLFALIRSAPTDERSARMLREYVYSELESQLQRAIGTGVPLLCVQLMGAHVIGLALMRYVVRLEPLASADPEAIVASMGQVLQHYLDPEVRRGAVEADLDNTAASG